jgi:hypothetical protein
MNTSYSEFLSTHPPLFSGGKDLLEADDWLCTTELKFNMFTVQSIKRLYMPLSSSEVQ